MNAKSGLSNRAVKEHINIPHKHLLLFCPQYTIQQDGLSLELLHGPHELVPPMPVIWQVVRETTSKQFEKAQNSEPIPQGHKQKAGVMKLLEI